MIKNPENIYFLIGTFRDLVCVYKFILYQIKFKSGIYRNF